VRRASSLARQGTRYLVEHPFRGLILVWLILAAAYIIAWGAATLRYRKLPPSLEIGHSAWHKVLAPRWAGGDPNADHADLPYATVGLRNGTTLAGFVWLYTVEPTAPEERELVIASPMKVRGRNEQTFRTASDQAVVVSGPDILTLSIKYDRVKRTVPPARRPFLRARS
jgi:hypothetical protein